MTNQTRAEIDEGLNYASGRLRKILERPVAEKHVLPQADEDHHRQIQDERDRGMNGSVPSGSLRIIPEYPGNARKSNKRNDTGEGLSPPGLLILLRPYAPPFEKNELELRFYVRDCQKIDAFRTAQ